MHKALLASWYLLSKTRSNYYCSAAVRTHFFWDAIQVRRFLGDQAHRLWSQATHLDWDASRIYSTHPAKFLEWRFAVFWVLRTPVLDLFPPLCTDWGAPLDKRQCSTRDTSCRQKCPAPQFGGRGRGCVASLVRGLCLALAACPARPLFGR